MHILYYVTSHGYGHGVRSSHIANTLSDEIQITFRTSLPYQFFAEELKRPFFYHPGEFDCGCIQSDGVTTDIQATLDTYAKIAERNNHLLQDEINWCKDHSIKAIISDITPFAFEVAHELNIPSVAITNFTWYDIYKEYLPFRPAFSPILETMKNQYCLATALIALSPSLKMDYFKSIYNVPVVGRKGENVRDKICSLFDIPQSKKIGLIYTGNFGMNNAKWKQLETFKDWEFLGVYPLPDNPSNFHLIKKEQICYQNLIASCDTMIAKLGYGSVSECMLNSKPIIYLPRTFFAEYPVLEQAVDQWGGGILLRDEDFYSLKWEDALDKAVKMKPKAVKNRGTELTCKIIESILLE